MITKIILSLMLVNLAVGESQNATNWNYDDHGENWDFDTCNGTYPTQSPHPLLSTPGGLNQDWNNYMFSFLTGFKSLDVTESEQGVMDYVYKVKPNVTGSLGGWYAAEPISYNPQHEVYWQINETRFHYPGEHLVDSQPADAEFQIIGYDIKNQAFYCNEHLAAIAIRLMVDDSQTESPFWSQWVGKTSFTYDLGTLIPKYIAMEQPMIGYLGTDTMPNCTAMCWYVMPNVQYISTATFEAIKTMSNNIEFNNRISSASFGLSYMSTPLFPPATSSNKKPQVDL